MATTQQELEQARELLDRLLNNHDEAEAYSADPEGYLAANGYENVSAEAVQACGVGSGASASAGIGSAPPPGGGVAGAIQQVDYAVYNQYYTDNSITNNIANNGFLDLEQNIDQTTVQGEGNVVADDGSSIGQAQTGDGQQAGDGGVNVDGDVDDSQIQTGDGIQAGDDVNIDGSTVNTGSGGIDQSTNIDDHSVDIDDHSTNVDDHSTTEIDDHSVNTDVDVSNEVDAGLF